MTTPYRILPLTEFQPNYDDGPPSSDLEEEEKGVKGTIKFHDNFFVQLKKHFKGRTDIVDKIEMYRLATKMHELRNDNVTKQLVVECVNDLEKALRINSVGEVAPETVGKTGIGAVEGAARATAISVKYQLSGPVIQIRY